MVDQFQYEIVPGVFEQSEHNTNPNGFDYSSRNFGLIDRAYPSDTNSSSDPLWDRLTNYIDSLNAAAPPTVHYKLFYFGRHGEGFHNVAETQYGTHEWDEHWSKLDGDGTKFWFDSHLTDLGRSQALHAHAFFKTQFDDEHMPAPQTYYASPLYRTLDTCRLTFSGLDLPSDRPFRPFVKEMAREVLGEHTCDKRSARRVVVKAFPQFTIEAGFTEEDELWKADYRETDDEIDIRQRKLLDDVFANDSHSIVSLTSHSGAIASLLRVLGHRKFALLTGGLIPVLVKGSAVGRTSRPN